VPIERYADENAATRLRQATRPFVLRRVKSDPAVLDRPAGQAPRPAPVQPYRRAGDALPGRARRDADPPRRDRDRWRKGIVLSAMTKLQQVCNHPAHLLGDGSPLPGGPGKLERLEAILDRVWPAARARCASPSSPLRRHADPAPGGPVRCSRPISTRRNARAGARDEMVADFQADPRPGVFVLSLKAGGTG
jgi:SNF2 family DNA or RNA helicase